MAIQLAVAQAVGGEQCLHHLVLDNETDNETGGKASGDTGQPVGTTADAGAGSAAA
ncbi:hypothetical protein GCM10022214_26640 [Actinomadura miaoliensis]|uniref:Uncharacterized protein n=1 Tax=Actinomadura miaoliensis TaxID=430685 RepID=A0ABP7VLI3_9ACTN